MSSTGYTGQAARRVDGRLKVTGQAKYAAENAGENMTYGYVISSAIAKGRIKKIGVKTALAVPGVLQVFTHENVPGLAWFDSSYSDQDAPPAGSPFRPLHKAEIQFSQQPIALVVADTFEQARYAASLVEIEYESETHEADFTGHFDAARKPKNSRFPSAPRGDAAKALEKADVRIDGDYYHPAEHHNPMEMFATTVVYGVGGDMTIYDKTQGVGNSLGYLKGIFGRKVKKARVLSPYVGGGFGAGLRPQYQLFLAVLAATELKRSVKLVLTRQQMFSFGHRPATTQKITLGASGSGVLKSISNEAFSETSKFEDYTENVVNWSGLMYACADVSLEHKLVPLDVYTPLDMRAPGGVTGMFALECAMDELAVKLNMDPLELRLKNYAEKDQLEDKPFSSKELRSCYTQAAERFGWSRRKAEPGANKKDHILTGYGMATGCWEAMQQPSRAKAVLSADGKLLVSSGTSDIGTGTYTIMTQIAAETLGLPLSEVTFKLGDSDLVMAPLQGGSWTAASVGSAVKKVCVSLAKKVHRLAKHVENSPLAHTTFSKVEFADGHIRLKSDPEKKMSIRDVMQQSGENFVSDTVTSIPNFLKQRGHSSYSHSAVFVEVEVDEMLGTIRVPRVVSAIAGGKILNPKTAKSQIEGAVVWGIGMALHEESVIDPHFGRFMNHNLAEYHVPVNADIQDIEVIFVEEKDDIVNPIGVKGLGEIGIVGVAAAISNAIYNATGKRVRDLPITLDKLL